MNAWPRLTDIPNAITEFQGEHYWLDNMWLANIRWNNSLTFHSVEQGFVYFKSRDPKVREAVLACADPYECKAIGRTPGVMREDWDQIKFMIMAELVRRKFAQHEDLMKKLLNTGDRYLVEGNTWDDNIWGDCICANCRHIPGQNMLGQILMGLRAELREG